HVGLERRPLDHGGWLDGPTQPPSSAAGLDKEALGYAERRRWPRECILAMAGTSTMRPPTENGRRPGKTSRDVQRRRLWEKRPTNHQDRKSHVDPRPGSHRHLPLPHPRRGPARARLRVEAHRPALEGQRRHRQRRRDHLDDQHVALLAVRVDAPVAPPDQAGVRGVELSWKAKGRFNGREGGYSSRRERERNMDGMIEGETQCGATGGVRNTPRCNGNVCGAYGD
ncbi:hypothetical protein THAOC_31098, partial [Thalassiosira oceanica]